MDSPAASPAPPAPSAWARRGSWALILALALYGVLTATHLAVFAGGSDSSGYLNNVRLLRAGSMHVPQRAIEGLPPGSLPYFAYVTLGFTPVAHGQMVPTYPIGLSLLIAAISCVVGWDYGAHVTVWLHAMAGVILIFFFARRLGFGRLAATLAALLLGGSPLYLFNGLQALSDTPALVWTMAAMFAAWRARERPGWAVSAGVAVAMAVLIRPSNLLVLLPVGVALGGSLRRWFALILGGLPGAVFLAIYNHSLYGRVLTTGYGDVSGSFSRDFIGPALANYVHWLPMLLTPAVGLVLVLPFVFRRVGGRLTLLLLAWIAVFAGFYAWYYFTAETWWALRFILPIFPACILGSLLAGRALAHHLPARWRTTALAVALAATAGWQLHWNVQQQALESREGEEAFRQVADWTKAHLPPRAVVVCMQTSGALLYYTDFTLLRYDFAGDVTRIDAACAAAGRPIYAALFSFELHDALERRLPGQWTQIGATRNATYWRRDGSVPTPLPPTPWQEFTRVDAGGTDLTLMTGPGWYGAERAHFRRWSWCSGRGELRLETWPRRSGTVELRFLARAFAASRVTASQDGQTVWQAALGTSRQPASFRVAVHDGVAVIQVTSDTPPTPEGPGPDSRQLAFAFYDPTLINVELK